MKNHIVTIAVLCFIIVSIFPNIGDAGVDLDVVREVLKDHD